MSCAAVPHPPNHYIKWNIAIDCSEGYQSLISYFRNMGASVLINIDAFPVSYK